MQGKEEAGLIETTMEKAFAKMYSNDMVNQLTGEKITEFQRGEIAGQIKMMIWIANEFNPQKIEEVEDEDGLSGQKL